MRSGSGEHTLQCQQECGDTGAKTFEIGLDEILQNTGQGPREKTPQELKVRARDLEDLEKKGCEQRTAGEDDLPQQEFTQKTEEAIQPGKD